MAPDEAVPEGALPEAVLARMEEVSHALGDVSRRLQAVAESSKNTRRLAIGLAVSIFLDVALTIIVTLLSLSALSQGSTLHQSQLAACSITNQSRIEQRALWGYLFQLTGGVKTLQEKQLLNYVDKTFAPENCAVIYK